MNNLEDIKSQLREFVRVRNWDQFHSPKNLSMALIVEAAELVEHFQWLTEEESINIESKKLSEVEEEIADIFIYLMRLSDKLNINLLDAVSNKIAKNEKKYPADLVSGSSKKYTEY
jgi:NTP pyrophosphatase (non-canonical NTP hydrolase)